MLITPDTMTLRSSNADVTGLQRAAPVLLVRIEESTASARGAQGLAPLLDLPDPQATGAIAAWGETEDFRRLLAALSPEQRAVLWLRFAKDLTPTTIAAKTGWSVGAVKGLQCRGLRHLQGQWGQGNAPGSHIHQRQSVQSGRLFGVRRA